MRARLGVLVLAWVAMGLLAVTFAARLEPRASRFEQSAPATQAGERAIVVFVDSLSDRVAEDEAVMPALAALGRRGVAFRVEPCRDQLTFLCLQAAFSGHDESRLLALSDNFEQQHRAASDTLFHALARQGRAAVAIGSDDLALFGDALSAARYVPRTRETTHEILSAWSTFEDARRPALALIGLGAGDLAAHAHGPGSREYRSAFAAIDRTIAALDRARPPETHLVVLGDHGHDATGSHLPGSGEKTWAVYVGPALRSGARSELAMTAHHALLGVLLGLPVPTRYAGPPLDQVFRADWLAHAGRGVLPEAEVEPSDRGTEAGRLAVAAALGALGAALFYAAFRVFRVRRAAAALVAALLAGTAFGAGSAYDALRRVLHDHGFSPERSLYLIVPAGIGFGAAALLRATSLLRPARPGAWLPTGAAATLLVTLVCLFPSAYFYGSSRAAVTIGLFVLAALAAEALRETAGDRRARAAVLLATALSGWTLVTFLRVGRADASTSLSGFVLKAAVYQGSAWLPLVVAKLTSFVLLSWSGGTRRPYDLAGAASLLTASLLVQLGSAALPRAVYAALALCLLATVRFAARRAPATQLAAGLLLLNHFYGPHALRLAPIELLLSATSAALAAWQRSSLRRDSRDWAAGLTLATSAYLLLWPMFGFRLSGIDFRFMFEWVPEQRYESWWWVIALGSLSKLAVPFLLLGAVAGQHAVSERARRITLGVLGAKVTMLSVMAAAYSARHFTRSELAVDMLGELMLVTLALPWIAAWTLGAGPPTAEGDRPGAPPDGRSLSDPAPVAP